MNARTLSFALTVAWLVGGCSIFGDEDDTLPPAELIDFKQTLDLRKVWSASVGDGTETLRLAIAPIGDGSNVYAASYDGVVTAFEPKTGKRVWRTEVDALLSAGPGTGEGLVVVAGKDGDIIALDASDGSLRWQVDVVGESLAAPVVTREGVVVYTIDGRLRVLNLLDGREAWGMQQDLPALTLRGQSTPVVVGGTVMVGFDNGRLVALDLDNGNTEWESMISPPSGRSDLERLSDIDGRLQAVGQDLYASGFNGRIAALAVESGQMLWAREFSTYTGVGADWNNIYFVTNEGEVVALLRRNGSDVWRSDILLRREPTAPVAFDLSVAVADFEGYVHFFDNTNGAPVARVRVGSDRISLSPVVIGDQLYVQSESGTLVVYEAPKPEPADDEADGSETP